MKKIALFIFVLAMVAVLAAPASFAQTATTTQSQTAAQLQELIKKLNAQAQALQEQLKQVQVQRQQVSQTISEIITTLKEGDKSENVKTLQALLAADLSIYPEGLITGFYGPLTTKAVRKFQEKHGLEKVGFVGPKTKIKLNELLKEHPLAFEKAEKIEKKIERAIDKINKKGEDEDDNDEDEEDDDKYEKNRLCAIVPPGHLIAPGWLKKHNGVKPVIPECQDIPHGIKWKSEWATSTPASTPPTPTSTPDIIAPVISSITVSGIASSTAMISWTTNESATSKVYYSTSAPLDLLSASTLSVSDAAMSVNHSLNLSGLTASSTYYFAVESKDAANNTATSSQQMFNTLQ